MSIHDNTPLGLGLPSTRAEALAAASKLYFTGLACSRGHIAPRWTASFGCRDCTLDRQRAAYAHDPEKHRERTARFRRNKPDHHREYSAARRRENPEWALEYDRQQRARQKETRPAVMARYFKANPAIFAAARHRRRARLNACAEHFTAEELAALWGRVPHRCANSACATKLTLRTRRIDHIQPLAGDRPDNSIRNIQFLCAPCNTAKNARDPLDWMRRNGLLC